MITRTESKQIFDHVIDKIFELDAESGLRFALSQQGVKTMYDLLEIGALLQEYHPLNYRNPKIPDQELGVNMSECNLVRFITRVHNDCISKNNGVPPSSKWWFDLDYDSLMEQHHLLQASIIAHHESESVSQTTTKEEVKSDEQVVSVRGRRRLDVSSYPKWNGELATWYAFKQKLIIKATSEGIDSYMSPGVKYPDDNSPSYLSFRDNASYFMEIYNHSMDFGQGAVELAKYINQGDQCFNGYEVYRRLLAYCEKTSTVASQRTRLQNSLITMRIRKGNNNPLKFFQDFQRRYLDLEKTGLILDDMTKLSYLWGAVSEHPDYLSVQASLEAIAESTNQPVSFELALKVYIQDAEKKSNSMKVASANKTKSSHKNKKHDDNKKSSSAWKTDLTLRVPWEEYKKLSADEKLKRKEARNAKKPATINNTTAASNTSADSSTSSVSTLTNPPTKATVNNTNSIRDPSEDVKPEAIPPGESQPSLRQIMRANVSHTVSTLSPGTYTNDQGKRYTINHTVVRRINNNESKDASLSLIDLGADVSVAGANMRLLERHVDPEYVQVKGPNDEVQNGMTHLEMANHCGVAITQTGEKVLLVLNNSLMFPSGKTILCYAQLLHSGNKLDVIPKKYGGSQIMQSIDDEKFNLVYKGGLMFVKISYPSDDDIKHLPRVILTSDEPWDPSNENDDDDEFYDCSEPAFNDDSYSINDHDINFFECSDSENQHDLLDFEINKLRSEEIEKDFEKYRPYFGYRPLDVIKKTFAATTQFGRNMLRFPMRRHFKSRFHALRYPRLNEDYSTDTFFSSVTSIEGYTCAQLYVGKTSNYTKVFGMKSENQFCSTLLDFFRSVGIMRGLYSDNAKSETSKEAKRYFRLYGVKDKQSEPKNQQQNRAERRIQSTKTMTNTILDRSGAPKNLWFLCLMYVVLILNVTAHATLNDRTPTEVAMGTTPDISAILCFRFYEPVYYLESDAMFPHSKESKGRFVGIAENVGDALTFFILTSNNTIIARSVVRSAEDDNNLNLRADADYDNAVVSEPVLESELDTIPIEERQAYTISPDEIVGRTFLREHQVDGAIYRAEVIQRVKDMEDGCAQYLIKLGDGERTDVVTYNEILQSLEKELERDSNLEDGQFYMAFKSIDGHRKAGAQWQIRVCWEDGSKSWELLSVFAKDDPITVAKYAKEKSLLDIPGWKRFKRLVKNEKKIKRLSKAARSSALRSAPKYKFGFRVPKDVTEARTIDTELKQNRWNNAIKLEMDQVVIDYETFDDLGMGASTPENHTRITVHLVFDVKSDGRHKARLVAGGHLTPTETSNNYTGVVSLKCMRIVMFIAELNDLELKTGDISNAYLTAKTNERVVCKAGPEFRDYGLEGHTLRIVKALYGLKTSGTRFFESFAKSLLHMGFKPSLADTEVWIKDCDTHYEYCCTYVDDILYAGKDSKGFFDEILKLGYKLKGVGDPKYHLGGDFRRVEEDGKSYLTWGSTTYINRMLDQFELLMGYKVPSERITSPLDPKDKPELDTSELLKPEQIKIYQSLIGSLQWSVTLGRIDLMVSIMSLARFRPAPRKGHLERLIRIFKFLRNYKKSYIKFDTEIPDYSAYEVEKADWAHIYNNTTEDIPTDAPTPKGKPVLTTTFFDASLMFDAVTGRGCTGVLHMLNKTLVDWYSKRQNLAETSSFSVEMVSARTAVDQIIELRYILRMLGVPLTGPSYAFGDNLSMIKTATIPNYKLAKRHNIMNFHRVRQVQSADIVRFVHMNGVDNPADILTKYRSCTQWFGKLKSLIFSRIKDNGE